MLRGNCVIMIQSGNLAVGSLLEITDACSSFAVPKRKSFLRVRSIRSIVFFYFLFCVEKERRKEVQRSSILIE